MIKILNVMREDNFIKQQEYIRAKKKVKKIKDFYSHLSVYIIVNIGISGVIIWGLTKGDDYDLPQVFTNFGVYSTWLFWGIGVFFHWLNVFGGIMPFLGSDWEERKINELMKEDERKSKQLNR